MPVIELSTIINAPIAKCFDVARDIDVHVASTAHTGERAIAGRTGGLIELGETVTWQAKHFQAKHFGVWQNLTSRITAMDRPHSFTDVMVSGAFKSFTHDHYFTGISGQTVMKDRFEFESPFGWFGNLANNLFLTKYMANFLEKRNQVIKRVAEGNPVPTSGGYGASLL